MPNRKRVRFYRVDHVGRVWVHINEDSPISQETVLCIEQQRFSPTVEEEGEAIGPIGQNGDFRELSLPDLAPCAKYATGSGTEYRTADQENHLGNEI